MSDSCEGCGVAWTTSEEAQQPSTTLWRGCDCHQHQHPIDNERVQHNILHRHRYRAFTKQQAQEMQAKANITEDRARAAMRQNSQRIAGERGHDPR